MQDRDKEILRNRLSDGNLANVYNQAIRFFADGVTDKYEYQTFKSMTLQKDITALAHAYLGMVFTFEEYWNKLQMIVGWDLMIQGLIDGSVKRKSNGHDVEEA